MVARAAVRSTVRVAEAGVGVVPGVETATPAAGTEGEAGIIPQALSTVAPAPKPASLRKSRRESELLAIVVAEFACQRENKYNYQHNWREHEQ